MLDLIDRWEALWEKIPHKGNIWRLYGEIVTRYSEPHRFYHNLWHIRHCLKVLDEARHLCRNPDEVEMALWFHDVIYNFGEGDNEKESAFACGLALAKLGVDPGFRDRVWVHILATKHQEAPEDPDSRIVADIDISIMGYPEAVYLEGEKRIFWEFEWVPVAVGKVLREKHLRGFLGRDRIFATDYFRDKYEDQARKNLAGSLKRLGN
jgi:predicted metal-dependent HD superfamily phosphohydrolase